MNRLAFTFLIFLLAIPNVQAQTAARGEKFIALTFDDGPTPNVTPALLDVLKEYNVKATFFVLGEQIADNRPIIRRMDAEGHELGNHTMSHRRLTGLDRDELRSEIVGASAALRQVTGKRPTVFRPPFSALDTQAVEVLRDKDLAIALFSINSGDSDFGSSAVSISDRIVSQAKDGDIVFLHDTARLSVEATEMAIRDLSARGFRFVTVSELISRKGTAVPGTVYHSAYRAQQP